MTWGGDPAARFRAVFEHAPIGMALVSLGPADAGRPLLVNARLCEILGYSEQELLAVDPARLSHPDDLELRNEETLRLAAGEIASFSFEKRFMRADGSTIWGRMHVSLVDEPGPVKCAMMQLEDITEQRTTSDQLRRLAVIVETSRDAIFSVDRDGNVLSWNPAAEAVYGRRAVDVLGHPLARAAHVPEIADHDGVAAEFENVHVREDGRAVHVAMSVSPLFADDGSVAGTAAIVRDVTERKRLEDELRRRADFDQLTGVCSRRRFEAAVEQAIATAARHERTGAVLVVDVDHFKLVNDSLGHSAGDEVLRRVAAALGERLRAEDVVGRLGGDEFAVLLAEGDQSAARTVADHLLDRIRDLGTIAPVTASVGIAVFGRGVAQSVDQVLAAADVALYEAKEAGRDRALTFSGTARNVFTWYQDIGEALAEDRLVLHGQPIIELATGQLVARELLVRMVSQEGELIPPAAFLPTAERFDLIGAIDRWVIAHALALDVKHRVNINLSARSISDTALLPWLMDQIQRSSVPPERLVFEITETAAIAQLAEAQRFVERLRGLGCGVALDDFGTGFGSFAYLKHLPVSQLKIDMEFVRGLTASEADQRIVQAVARVAEAFGIRTVAEGVEDAETLELLREYGVDDAQGYYIGRPAPLEETAGPVHTVGELDGVTVLEFAGELDLATAPDACARIDRACQRHRPRLLIDLTALEFCDSTGLRALVYAAREARARRGQLVVVAPVLAEAVRVFEVAGASHFLPLVSDRDQALAVLSRG